MAQSRERLEVTRGRAGGARRFASCEARANRRAWNPRGRAAPRKNRFALSLRLPDTAPSHSQVPGLPPQKSGLPSLTPRARAPRRAQSVNTDTNAHTDAMPHQPNATKWQPAELQLLAQLLNDPNMRLDNGNYSWERIAARMQAAGFDRDMSSCRCCKDRLEQGRARAARGEARNRCTVCGQLRAGHVCTGLPTLLTAEQRAARARQRWRNVLTLVGIIAFLRRIAAEPGGSTAARAFASFHAAQRAAAAAANSCRWLIPWTPAVAQPSRSRRRRLGGRSAHGRHRRRADGRAPARPHRAAAGHGEVEEAQGARGGGRGGGRGGSPGRWSSHGATSCSPLCMLWRAAMAESARSGTADARTQRRW